MDITYYLISPKSDLLEKLASYKRDNAVEHESYLADTFVWSAVISRQPQHTGYSSVEVPLVFLAFLHTNFVIKQEVPELKPFVELIFGDPPFGLATFWRWWSLHTLSFGVESLMGDILPNVSSESLSLLAKTNIPLVDTWLEDVINNR
jgi:hypothetical protein